MNTTKRQTMLSMSVVAVGATVLGMVLAGGLGLTPSGTAAKGAPAALVSAPLAPPAGYPDFATLAERVNPAVVSVYTEDVIKPQDMRRFHQDMDPFEFFFGPGTPHPDMRRQQKRTGAGSGFFISTDGLIVTNNHVVESAEKIKVSLADNTELSAKVAGRDPATDVALIRVDGKGPFTPLSLGDSDTLRVGEWAISRGAWSRSRRISVFLTAHERILRSAPDDECKLAARQPLPGLPPV